uniref:Uncharacterized protein n=1 Tax=Arundo donax TaxID=35708 RepID=A0A0A9RLF7_ARUDO
MAMRKCWASVWWGTSFSASLIISRPGDRSTFNGVVDTFARCFWCVLATKKETTGLVLGCGKKGGKPTKVWLTLILPAHVFVLFPPSLGMENCGWRLLLHLFPSHLVLLNKCWSIFFDSSTPPQSLSCAGG